ncbi:MAG: hypothetical protein ACQERJ_06500 [Bacillota bacterium]
MLLFKSEFKKDLIILLVVTILLSSLLALVIGDVSDYYFGDAVNSLIGDYENNDLLLIIDQQRRAEIVTQIKAIVQDKIPGSKVVSGISLAGKSNAFIAVADKYKTRAVFLQLEDYFKEIEGVSTTSIMTEPRLTINGLKDKTAKLLEAEIADLQNVAFTFPDGDNLEIIIKEAQFSGQVKEEVEQILDSYQSVGIRFPMDKKVEQLSELGEQIEAEINERYSFEAYNVTESNTSNLDSLVKTMTEMKSFLSSYAAEVKIKMFANKELMVGDKLVIPAKNKGEIHLRVSSVNDMIATAVITIGDSSEILDELAYTTGADNNKTAVGKVEISNPRHNLAGLVQELNKLLPQLDSTFSAANQVVANLEEIFSTLELLNNTTGELERLNNKVAAYQGQVQEFDLPSLKQDLLSLEQRLTQLVVVIKKLEVVKSLIVEGTAELAVLKEQVTMTKQEFTAGSKYYNNLQQLEDNINKLVIKIDTNTTGIINYINRYNPLLREIQAWQQRVQEFNSGIDKLIAAPQSEFSTAVKEIIRPELITKIKGSKNEQAEAKLQEIKTSLKAIKKIDFAAITEELEYMQQALPKLKDEEITASVDLLDQYLAGKVLPGDEISILLAAEDINLTAVKSQIEDIINQPFTVYDAPPGVIVPNLRSQIYQILSEVKIILTAVTAVICTVLSLLFDQGLIVSSLQQLNRGQKWYQNSALYYSAAVGGVTLGSIIYLTGFNSPYLPQWSFWLLGSGLGLLLFKEAKTITGISPREFRAGAALGFNYGQIMRQIIVPAGKPGLLRLLNQRQTYF